MLLLKLAPYFVLNFIWKHRVSMLTVICGNRGFFCFADHSRKMPFGFQGGRDVTIEEGGEVLRKALLEGIKNNY